MYPTIRCARADDSSKVEPVQSLQDEVALGSLASARSRAKLETEAPIAETSKDDSVEFKMGSLETHPMSVIRQRRIQDVIVSQEATPWVVSPLEAQDRFSEKHARSSSGVVDAVVKEILPLLAKRETVVYNRILDEFQQQQERFQRQLEILRSDINRSLQFSKRDSIVAAQVRPDHHMAEWRTAGSCNALVPNNIVQNSLENGARREVQATVVGNKLDAAPDTNLSEFRDADMQPRDNDLSDTHRGERLFKEGSAPANPFKIERSLSVNSSQIDEYSIECKLSLSMWDVCCFIGQPCCGLGISFCLCLGAIVNTSMQCAFCAIVLANMASAPIDETSIAAARHWRGVVGHDIRFADPVRKTSLVTRLCSQDTSLHYSAMQFGTYGDFSEYLSPSDSSFDFLNGQVLSIISVIAWTWSILADMNDNLLLSRAVFSQKFGRPVLLYGERLTLESNGPVQLFAFGFFSTLPRFFTSSLLYYIGMRFLAYTTSMYDLLLNAMTLTFVLDIDELVFSFIAPRRIRNILDNLKPLMVSAQTIPASLRGGAAGVVMRIAITCVSLIIYNVEFVTPFLELMEDLTEELCGGNQNFVVTTHKALGIVMYTVTNRLEDDLSFGESYEKTATLDLVQDTGIFGANWTVTSRLPLPWESLLRISSADVKFSADLTQCIDHTELDEATHAYKSTTIVHSAIAVLQDALQNKSITHCYEVDPVLCRPFTNTIVRAVCAITCGCDTPWKGLFYGTPSYGCPGRCAPNFILNLDRFSPPSFIPHITSCQDVPQQELEKDQSWLDYLDGVASARNNGEAVWLDLGSLKSAGCRGIAEVQEQIDLCEPNSAGVGRSVRPFCPKTCGCSFYNFDECPLGCK